MKFNGATFQGGSISQKIAFDPELTRAMAAAFDMVYDAFGLQKDTTDAQTNSAIANMIIEFAEEGERDPDQLCAKTVQALMREQNS